MSEAFPLDPRFAELVQQHAGLVHRACLRQVGAGDAEDAAQAVFLVLAQRWRDAIAGPAIEAWLLATSRRVCANVRRGRERRQHREAVAARGIAMFTATESTPVDQSPLLEHLDAALARLPEGERQAVETVYLAGVSQAELARRLNCPQGTIRARVHRGLERLRSHLTAVVPGLTVAALASVLSIEGASAAEPLAWGSASQQAHALAQADRRVSLTQLTLAASAAALVVATGWWMWPVAPITATEDPLVAEAPAALLHRPSDWIPAAVPFSLHLLDGERTRQRLSHSVYGSLALVAGSNAQQIADAGFTWATQCLSLFGRGPGLVSGAQRGMSWSGHGLRGCSLSLDKLSPEVPAPQNEVFLPEIFGAKMSMIMPNRFRFGAALSCTDPSFSTFLEPWLQGPIPASPWSGSRSGLDLSIDAPFYRIGSASTDPAPLAPVQPDPAADLMFYEGLDSCSWRILPDNGCHGVRLCSDPDIPRMAGLAKPLERNAIIRAPDGSLAIYVRSGDDLAVPIRRWMVEALRMVVPPSDDQHGQLHQTLAARHDHLDQLLADHSFPKDLTVHGTFSVAIGWDGLWPWVAIEAETTPEEAAAWLAGTEQWSHMSEKATFAENFYLKMFTLVAGYQEGRLRMTTHAAGLAAWHGAGAFARQPDVQTALAHIPADAEGCVVVREQALATVLCQFMGWMYHADQDTTSTTPLWKTVPTGSFAARIRTAAPEIVRLLANTHGVVWMRHEPGGLHVEAEGPLTGLLIPLWPVLFGGSVPLRQFAN